MKKLIIPMMFVALVACNQQRQEQPQGQAAYPGSAMMKTPEEIRQLQQLADQAPKNAEAWTMLGNALMDSNRFGEAADAYRKSLALEPKNANVRVDLGTCLKNAGRPQEAIEEYRKAIKYDPNHLNAHRNSAVVLMSDLHDKKGAIKEFEKYLELAPAAPDAPQIRQLVASMKAGQ